MEQTIPDLLYAELLFNLKNKNATIYLSASVFQLYVFNLHSVLIILFLPLQIP